MKKAIIIFILIGLVFNLKAQDSLDNYIVYGLKNSPSIKAKYAAYEAAVKYSESFSVLPNPTLSMAYFLNPIETRIGAQRMRVALSQKIPWFGTIDK